MVQGGGLYGANGLRVFATAQPLQLPTNDGNRPRTSAQNQTVPEKPINLHNIYRHVRSTKKAGFRGGTTSLPVPNGGPVDDFMTGDPAPNAPLFIQFLRGDTW